ncbi:MarR family transcriptional regulator [Chryseobacterium sp. CH21]|uniref:MarR family transcriptional regulator n=1 Tax=Chryseobacterium sp. CH21 TaxID=713556 RepID=UPI00100BB44C|nr:helix-turn-helix domain-containing protein [Chryseobacterium sp. CH21]RXM39115.1 MarR family transcriptional regulator [Chryseobacterium sp. CH21]
MVEDDFLSQIDLAGLTSRLKRLSDTILYSTKDFYKSVGADIEPNWHLMFLLLKNNPDFTITEISEKLKMSHPAVIKIIQKMKERGYLITITDKIDSRKQIVKLTEKSFESLPQFEKFWSACTMTMQELVADTPDFLRNLDSIEEKVRESSYKERTLKNLKK